MSGVIAARRGRRPQAAAAFAPTDIASIKGWWAASAITGKVDGDALTAWNDASGQANNLSGGSPLYKTNVINGQPVVRFTDAGSQTLASSNFTLNQPAHTFIVCKYNQTYNATQNVALDCRSSIFVRLFYRTSSTNMTMYSGATGPSVATTPQSFHLYSALFNGASSELRIDGGSATTGNVGATNAAGIRMGGIGDNSDYHCDIDRAEVIVYSTALSSTDRGSVETYLKTKYGIA